MHLSSVPSYTLFLMHSGFYSSERYCFLRAWPVVINAAKQRMERVVIIVRCLQSRCDKRSKRIGLLYIQVELEHLDLETASSLCFPNSCLNNSWPVTIEAEDTLSGFPFTHSHFCLNCHVSVPFPCFPWKVCLCVLPLKQSGFYMRYLLYGIT